MLDHEEDVRQEGETSLLEKGERESGTPGFCGKCGAPLTEGVKFCGRCGASVDGSPSGQELQQLAESAKAAADAQEETRAADAPPNSENQGAKDGQAVKDALKMIKTWVERIAGIALIIFLYWAFFTKKPILDVQNMVFEQYSSRSFKEAVNLSIPEPTWEKEKLGKKHYMVTVSGFCPDLYSNIEIIFDVNYSGGDAYGSVEGVRLDGEYYDDLLSIGIVMGAIY